MKKKTFIVQLLDSKKPSRTSFTQVEDANFYSNDTDASLIFIPHEDTFDFQSAKVVMYNHGDESLVERDMVVATENGRKVASYELPDEIISHWGEWVAQPVFISDGEIYSGSIVLFSVFRYLMHDRPAKLTEVVTVREFIQQSQALVDDMVQAEAQRKTQEQTRQSAETVRVQAENERSVKYESYAQQFNDVILDLSEEKDYNSLPEISGARGGFDTLGERLDNERNEVAEQLEGIAVNLKSFGAVGDGVANDTAKFIEAINLLSQKGGGTLVVPSGDYLIDPDVIQLKSNVHIKGTGKSRIFTDHGIAYEYMFGNHVEELRNIEISGLEFDQIKEVGRFEPITNTLPTRMISIYCPIDVHINNNHFNNLFGQHAILAGYWEASEGTRVRNNRVTCNRFLPNTTEMYDASAIYVDDKYHEISGNIIQSIKTDYLWWKIPGAIERHGNTGIIRDNVIENAYIFLNISGGLHLTREGQGHISVYSNKVFNVHKGVSLWTRKDHAEYSDLKPIENLHIFDNTIMLDIAFTAEGNYAVGFEPGSSTGVLNGMTIHNNIITGQADYSDYAGIKVLSTYYDFTAFKLSKQSGEVENVTIENNLIKNFGGGVLSTGPNDQTNLTVKNVSFRNNKIIDPLQFPFIGTYWGMFDIGVGENINIVDNEIEFTSESTLPVNIPEMWLLAIGATVKKFTYLNNEQIEGNVAMGGVKTNNINNKEYNIDVGDYLRSPSKSKTDFIANTSNPTEGTYYPNHSLVYVGNPYNEGFRGKVCASRGTSGSNPNLASRKYLKQFVSSGTYNVGDIIDFGGTVVTVTGKNGIDYYTHQALPALTDITINYKNPVWVNMQTK